MNTKIMSCDCHNEQQDRIYGNGRRVHNQLATSGKKGDTPKYRCTVCGKEKVQ